MLILATTCLVSFPSIKGLASSQEFVDKNKAQTKITVRIESDLNDSKGSLDNNEIESSKLGSYQTLPKAGDSKNNLKFLGFIILISTILFNRRKKEHDIL